MNLRQEIYEAQQEIVARENGLRVWQQHLQRLQARQSDCTHEWEPALKGYEHEGGICKHCGINEVYAASNKIGKKTMPTCEFCGNPTGGPSPCCNEGAL